jgi:hypothetical protein
MKRNETELRSPRCLCSFPIWETLVSANGPGIKAGLAVGDSYHSSVARWLHSSWVLPTFLPVPRDQNSIFSNNLQPASLMPRSKGNFCPSCKGKPRGNLKLSLPPLYFLGGLGHSFIGTPHRNTFNQGLVTAPQLQEQSDSYRVCAR